MEDDKKKRDFKKDLRTGSSKESMTSGSAFSGSSEESGNFKTFGRVSINNPMGLLQKPGMRSSFASHSPKMRHSFRSIDGGQFASWVQRSSLRVAVFDLSTLESASSSSLTRRRRRSSPFSQDPRKRKKGSQKTPSQMSMELGEESVPRQQSGKPFFEPLQLVKTPSSDQSKLYFPQQQQANTAADKRPARQPASVHTVTVPKTGLIKLTGLPYEFDNPKYYDDRKERPAPRKYWAHTKFRYLLGTGAIVEKPCS